MNSNDTPNVISLPASLDGHSPCKSQDGQQIDLFGQALAPASPIVQTVRKKKQSDERHLWPTWSRLISQSKPPTIYGEQVDEAVAAGWYDDVCYDMEKENYACAAAVLPAASVNKNHERYRLFFVANSQMQPGVYEPKSREAKDGLYNHTDNWPANTWNEAMPKVYSIYDGLPTQNSLFNALGNAIVPEVAAKFIEATM